mgnify:CR=1 FL=1
MSKLATIAQPAIASPAEPPMADNTVPINARLRGNPKIAVMLAIIAVCIVTNNGASENGIGEAPTKADPAI